MAFAKHITGFWISEQHTHYLCDQDKMIDSLTFALASISSKQYF